MADRVGLRRALAARARTTSAACSRTRRRCSRSARRRRTRTGGSCPGYEAPVNLVYSPRNRSACIRIPMYSESPKAKRIEFRCPDPTANPYLAFSAMLMAGLDGIERGLDPGAPADYDLFEERPRRRRRCRARSTRRSTRSRPTTRSCSKGDVFSEDLIRDLDRLQARERGRRRAAPPAPGRVRPLLRLLRDACRAVTRGAPGLGRTGRRSPRSTRTASRRATRRSRPGVPSWEDWDARTRASRLVAESTGAPPAGPRSPRLGPRCYARRRRGQRLRRVVGAGAGRRARAARRADRALRGGRDLDAPGRDLPGERGEPSPARCGCGFRRRRRCASALGELDGDRGVTCCLLERRSEV